VLRKKGALNNALEILIFSNENGGFNFVFKAAVKGCILAVGALNHLPHDGFFLLLSGSWFIFNF